MTNLALGIDPSHSATGLALVSYNELGCVAEIMWTATVRRHTYAKMEKTYMSAPVSLLDAKLVTIERGFQGEFHRGGLEVAEVGRDWGGYLYSLLSLEPVYLLAIEWRRIFKGSYQVGDPKNPGKTDWTATARMWCSLIKGYDPKMSEHVCEAVGIAAAGIAKHIGGK